MTGRPAACAPGSCNIAQIGKVKAVLELWDQDCRAQLASKPGPPGLRLPPPVPPPTHLLEVTSPGLYHGLAALPPIPLATAAPQTCPPSSRVSQTPKRYSPQLPLAPLLLLHSPAGLSLVQP